MQEFKKSHPQSLPVVFHFCRDREFGFCLAQSTGSEAHWKSLGAPEAFLARTEEEFYQNFVEGDKTIKEFCQQVKLLLVYICAIIIVLLFQEHLLEVVELFLVISCVRL